MKSRHRRRLAAATCKTATAFPFQPKARSARPPPGLTRESVHGVKNSRCVDKPSRGNADKQTTLLQTTLLNIQGKKVIGAKSVTLDTREHHLRCEARWRWHRVERFRCWISAYLARIVTSSWRALKPSGCKGRVIPGLKQNLVGHRNVPNHLHRR